MKRGRPKGYSPYLEISYEDLSDYVGKKTLIKVCKNWATTIGLHPTQQDNTKDLLNNLNTEQVSITKVANEGLEQSPKIEFNITNFDE